MIEFRLSNPNDAESLSRCVDVVARERRHLAAVCGFTEDETRIFIRNLAETGGVQILALDESEVVGWCDVMPLPFEGQRHAGRLGMGLLPAYRGQGLGKRLLREVIERAFANGLLRIELEVFASNLAALHLYERAGFVTEGRKRRARILDGSEEDIVLMGLLHQEWLHHAEMVIRSEQSGDTAAIYAVHAASFPSVAEARLVDLLRTAGRLSVSLVGAIDDAIIGHIAFSPVTVQTKVSGAGLAPVAVAKAHRRQGVAAKLIRAGLEACRAAGFGWVVVLGEPAYYSRFGFRAASEFGLFDEYGGGPAFQCLEMIPGTLPIGAGLVRYAPEFASLG